MRQNQTQRRSTGAARVQPRGGQHPHARNTHTHTRARLQHRVAAQLERAQARECRPRRGDDVDADGPRADVLLRADAQRLELRFRVCVRACVCVGECVCEMCSSAPMFSASSCDFVCVYVCR